MIHRSCALSAGLLLPLVVGCKPNTAARQSEAGGEAAKPAPRRAAAAPIDPATTGSVSGVVKFSGKAPERLKIDMSMDPVCSMMGGQNDAEQYAITDGKLANVYVYVKSGPAAAMSAPASNTAPVIVDQKGCRYVPHVVAVMQGGEVEFRNSDATMHNIHTMPVVAGNAVIDVSQGPKGEPQLRRFDQPETMLPVRCNNHPWMNAFINVSATPFFAVTGADGKFNLSGLPQGTYTLGAVQEKMGEQTATVTVTAHGVSKTDFTFSPSAASK